MTDIVDPLKSGDEETPIPTIWRKNISEIVECLKKGNFKLDEGLPGVDPLSDEEAQYNRRSVSSYGDEIDSLPNEAWSTSVCRWMEGHWDIIVDLYTKNEGQSDLALFSKVYESEDGYRFKVISIHVP